MEVVLFKLTFVFHLTFFLLTQFRLLTLVAVFGPKRKKTWLNAPYNLCTVLNVLRLSNFLHYKMSPVRIMTV